MTVATILKDLSGPKYGGGALSADAIAALTRLRTQSAILGMIVFAAILAGAVLSAWMSFRARPGDIAAVAGGLGMSMGAALLLLLRTWKQWTQAGMLLILIEDANEATVRQLINQLSKKL